MKFAIFCLVAVCVASASASSLRLPLPTDVRHRLPWLVDEPITHPNLRAQNGMIVGGTNANEGQFPYQIALFRSGSFICGGSLIGGRTVLTAAHCVYGYENRPTSFSIRYGSIGRESGTAISVSKVTRHSSYSSSTIDYDIAVLTLATSFTPSSNAAVITLVSTEPAAGTNALLSGWGRTSAGGSLPTTLQTATLPIVTRTSCQSAWGSVNTITDRMLCAHSKTQSACNGDSGGPLAINGVQVGVVSWGSSSCLHATYPNVYANVATLRSWIVAQIVD